MRRIGAAFGENANTSHALPLFNFDHF